MFHPMVLQQKGEKKQPESGGDTLEAIAHMNAQIYACKFSFIAIHVIEMSKKQQQQQRNEENLFARLLNFMLFSGWLERQDTQTSAYS